MKASRCTYSVAIPSRGRPRNMLRMLKLFPAARVFVHKSEKGDYAPYVPDGQLLLHDIEGCMPAVRNEIRRQTPEHAVCMIDDDLIKVRSNVWRRPRYYTDSESLDQIIRNGVDVLCDLDKPLFAWSNAQVGIFFKNSDPFHLSAHFGSAWILRGRDYVMEERLKVHADTDLAMQVFLRDRITVSDKRFTFMFTPMFASQGGMTDLRTDKVISEDRLVLKRKWLSHCNVRKARNSNNTFMRTEVRRKSALGQR